jgi:hypothetical protein
MTDKTIKLDEAIGAEIRRELEIAKAKYGADHFEVLCIEGSWIDQLVDDRKTLLHLQTLSQTGSLYIAVSCEVD